MSQMLCNHLEACLTVQEEELQVDSDEFGKEIYGVFETISIPYLTIYGEDSVQMYSDGTMSGVYEETVQFNRFTSCTKICNSEISPSAPIIVKYNNYNNGYLDGSQMEFYSNGLLKSKMTYMMGKPIGEHIFYNNNGDKNGIINYDLEGQKHGQCVSKKDISEKFENYVHGKKQGKCFYVSSDGVKMDVYDNGNLVSTKPNVKMKELIEIYGYWVVL